MVIISFTEIRDILQHYGHYKARRRLLETNNFYNLVLSLTREYETTDKFSVALKWAAH